MNNDWREYIGDPSYELYHHGVQGMKWGVRRYQNADGSLTAAGKRRYGEKVTMHNTADNAFLGGRKYQTHKEYKTANKFAKGSYEYRKAQIRDEKKNSNDKFVAKNLRAMAKNMDNKQQYKYELARNRLNAGANEFKRDVIKNTAKNAAAATAVVGVGVLAGMLHANYMNNQLKKQTAGALPMNGMYNYYEYKVGKKQVAKYLAKAVGMGALAGVTTAINNNYSASRRVERADKANSYRRKRASDDERRWKQGKVGGSTGAGVDRKTSKASGAGLVSDIGGPALRAAQVAKLGNRVVNAGQTIEELKRRGM